MVLCESCSNKTVQILLHLMLLVSLGFTFLFQKFSMVLEALDNGQPIDLRDMPPAPQGKSSRGDLYSPLQLAGGSRLIVID